MAPRALVHRAAAVHRAAVRLPATRGLRGIPALTDREGRELLLQLRGMALWTFRLLLAEEDGLKLVSALLATVFENRHTLTPISQRTDAAFPSPAREWY